MKECPKKWETKELEGMENLWIKYGSYRFIELFVNKRKIKRKNL